MLCIYTQPEFYARLLLLFTVVYSVIHLVTKCEIGHFYTFMNFINSFGCDCYYINGFLKVGGLYANVVEDTAYVCSRCL
jgi:hypothetical protein